MTDPALRPRGRADPVFARVSPAQKNRIILALKRAATSSASSATASTTRRRCTPPTSASRSRRRSTSPRMPPTSSCSSAACDVLHDGILEGRKAFGNVMKYLLMGTSSNFGNMFSMAAASLFLPFLPMLPTQILLNNFLYDLAQITIPTDNVDADLHPEAAALGHRADPQLHALHRPDQLDLRFPDLLRAAARLSRARKRCSTPAGSSSRWRPRRWCSSSSARRAIPCAAGRACRWR